MLTVAQRDEFARAGLLRLAGAIDVADAHAMADRIWSFLADRAGVDRADPATWTVARPTGFQAVTHTGGLDPMWSTPVRSAIEDLIGTGDVHRERPRVLMTFPDSDGPWVVPPAGWHFDYVPLQPEPGLRALQVFVLLDEVLPGGGGTVVLTGSHRLVRRYVSDTGLEPRPKLVRGYLSSLEPWLEQLWSVGPRDGHRAAGERPTPDGVGVDGVPLRVVEAAGAAGDVYLMHSDCFHAAAPNTRCVPRMMATSVVNRRTHRSATR